MALNRGFANLPILDPKDLRASLLTLILRVSAALGLVVYLPSVYFLVKQGAFGLVLIDTVALFGVVGLLRFDGVPYRWRAAVVCLIAYTLGVGLLLRVGPISQIYLLGFSVVTVLLLGARVGLGAALLGSASLLAIGGLGHAAPEMALPHWDHGFGEWVVITINFTLVNTLITLAVGAVLNALEDALKTEVAHRLSLDRERTLLRTLIDALPDVVFTKDTSGRFVNCNPATLALFGLDREDQLAGRTVFDHFPHEIAAPYHADDMTVMAGRTVLNREEQTVDREGKTHWHLTIKVPLHDAAGETTGLIGISRDITDHKKLEGQLRQAQKMEAVGQLAGGIAHDFNNLLSVVLGYSDMMLADLSPGDSVRSDVEEIRRAGVRASDLTRQLLMFSRKQVVAPRVLDLNDVLASVDTMLRRLLGEDVDFTLVPGASLGHVRADPGSIEQVLVNLAVNARDAMPVGGKLTIGTANVMLDEAYASVHHGVAPGAYVMLSVTDTGCGIDQATLARIFEPFFTTKEKGKGTGLGLATVFGIVQQSGGSIWVYSEVGLGTTFKIYLPRIDDDIDGSRTSPVPSTLRGTETILLVEDEDQVRDVARGILLRHGYTVIEARSAGEAMLLSEQEAGTIHLLLSDVVMPQMSGPALAKRLALSRPEMKVLCMSGYTDDAAIRHGVIEAEFAYLQKPLTVEALTRKVRDVLDSTPR